MRRLCNRFRGGSQVGRPDPACRPVSPSGKQCAAPVSAPYAAKPTVGSPTDPDDPCLAPARSTKEGPCDCSELDPLPEGTLETLRKVSTSTIATQLYKRGFRQPQLLGVRPLSEVVDGFVGEAFTMRFIPMREDVDGLDPYRSGNTLQWDAFEALQPGQVLVVDSYRTATAASGGDMLMTRAWKRGRRRW